MGSAELGLEMEGQNIASVGYSWAGNTDRIIIKVFPWNSILHQ